MISLQIQKPVHFKVPYVYRYMNRAYIDQFFDDGTLEISSFGHFRSFPDEVRGDKSEGGGVVSGQGSDEGFTFHLMTQVGEDGYMLSASLESSKDLEKCFKTDSHFKIVDPLGFAAAVSSALAGSTQVFLGFCNYQPLRVIEKQVPGLSATDFTDKEGNFIIGGPGMMRRVGEMVGTGIDLMFLKEQRYQYQAEFRFVWTINTKFFPVDKEHFVKCKEAIQFCERVEP